MATIQPKSSRGRVMAHYKKTLQAPSETESFITDAGFIILRKDKAPQKFIDDMNNHCIKKIVTNIKRLDQNLKWILDMVVTPGGNTEYRQKIALDFADYYKLEFGDIRKGKRIVKYKGIPCGVVAWY